LGDEAKVLEQTEGGLNGKGSPESAHFALHLDSSRAVHAHQVTQAENTSTNKTHAKILPGLDLVAPKEAPNGTPAGDSSTSKLADKAAELLKQTDTLSRQQLDLAEKRLMANSEKIGNEKERALFVADVKHFEVNYLNRSGKKPNDSVSDMTSAMNNIAKIMESESTVLGDATLRSAQTRPEDTSFRLRLAEEVLHHCADPTNIDQGQRPVCMVESLQIRQYWRDPAAVSQLVSETFLTGKYNASGKTMDLAGLGNRPGSALMPDAEARDYTPYKARDDSSRGYASKLYDIAAVNIGLDLSKAGVKYVENDKGGYFENLSTGSVTQVAGRTLDYISSRTLVDINEKILGRREEKFVIESAPKDHKNLDFPAQLNAALELNDLSNPVREIQTASELSSALLKVQKEGQWPPLVSGQANMEPILSQWRRAYPGSSPGSGGHEVVVTKISADGKLCAIDNKWSKLSDDDAVKVSVSKLGLAVKATGTPQSAEFSVSMQHMQRNIDSKDFQGWKKGWLEDLPALAKANPADAMQKWVAASPEDGIAKKWLDENPGDLDGSAFVKRIREYCHKYKK